MMLKLKRSQKGFTFTEVLVAMAILATGTLVGMTLMTTSSNSLAYDRNRALGAELGVTVMEDLLNRYSADPMLAANPGTYTEYFDRYQNILPAGVGAVTLNLATPPVGTVFTVTWVVTWGVPLNNVMQIQLNVSWVVAGVKEGLSYQTFRSSQ